MRARFDAFVLDSASRELLREGRGVAVSPKALDLLILLVDGRPRALTKGELHERLWPDTFVVDANLSNLVAELRAALEDNAREPRFIRYRAPARVCIRRGGGRRSGGRTAW